MFFVYFQGCSLWDNYVWNYKWNLENGEVQKAFCYQKTVLTFHCLNKLFSKFLHFLGLRPRISKVFLYLQNNLFSQQVKTILITKYHGFSRLSVMRTKIYARSLSVNVMQALSDHWLRKVSFLDAHRRILDAQTPRNFMYIPI